MLTINISNIMKVDDCSVTIFQLHFKWVSIKYGEAVARHVANNMFVNIDPL